VRDLHNIGRFSKRVGVVYARDPAAYALIVDGCLAAARTLRAHALALLPERFTLEEFSRGLLGLSYLGEQRVAETSKVEALYQAERAHYAQLHGALLNEIGLHAVDGLYARPPAVRADRQKTERLLARSRRRGVMRWPKYMLTVDNWLDVALDKVER